MAGTKGKGSGLGGRMPVRPVDPVAVGLAAATGTPAEVSAEAPADVPAISLSVRLPRQLHRQLRQVAFDTEGSINAILIEAAERWLADRR